VIYGDKMNGYWNWLAKVHKSGIHEISKEIPKGIKDIITSFKGIPKGIHCIAKSLLIMSPAIEAIAGLMLGMFAVFEVLGLIFNNQILSLYGYCVLISIPILYIMATHGIYRIECDSK